jgi:putative glutamine amidotransferase
MKNPLILVTTSSMPVEDMTAVRLNHEYVNAVVKAGGVPVPVTNRFGLDELIAHADGLLLSGGVDVDPCRYGQQKLSDTVCVDGDRDELELALIHKYWQTGKPALAICRGLQVLNVAFGGGLIQDIPTWCGAVHTAGVEHPVTAAEGSLLARLTGTRNLTVNSYHHQAIKDLAPALKEMAVSPDGLIEAVYMPAHRFLWAVQWHPEFFGTKDADSRNIFHAFADAMK